MSAAPRTTLEVRVVPRASRDTLTRDAAGGLKAHLTASPVEGAANRALIALLAAALRVPKRRLTVVRGARSRTKVVAVEDCSLAEVARRLAATLGPPIDKVGGRG